MGEVAINEMLSSYGGTYAGISSHPEVQKAVETADAILRMGSYAVSDRSLKIITVAKTQ